MLNYLANQIINNRKSIKDVEDMILEKTYNEIEILDMLALINNIAILQNPLMDVIISNLFYGPYQRQFFMNNSLCYQIINHEMTYVPGQESDVAQKMVFFKNKNNLKAYSKNSKNKKSQVDDIEGNNDEKEKKVGHMFQFYIWKKSLDVRYILNGLVSLSLAIVMQIYSVYLIEKSKDADSAEETLEAIDADLTLPRPIKEQQRNAALDSLSETTDEYYNYITILLVIHTLGISYLFMNFQEILYARLRGIYIQPFTLSLVMNVISTVMIVYWL